MHHQAFYEVVASVIPLLFVAAAIEARYFTDKALTGFLYDPIGDALFRLALILFMTWGELEVLIALYDGHASTRTQTAVGFALLSGGIVVLAPMIRAQLDAIGRVSERAQLVVSLLLLLGFVGIVIYVATS